MIGFVISIVRMSEPYFKFLIKKEVCEWFGIYVPEDKSDTITQADEEEEDITVEKDSLAALLQSQLNIELVNIILQSISSHCSGSIKRDTIYKDFDEEDFNKKNTFRLKEIQIPDNAEVKKVEIQRKKTMNS